MTGPSPARRCLGLPLGMAGPVQGGAGRRGDRDSSAPGWAVMAGLVPDSSAPGRAVMAGLVLGQRGERGCRGHGDSPAAAPRVTASPGRGTEPGLERAREGCRAGPGVLDVAARESSC